MLSALIVLGVTVSSVSASSIDYERLQALCASDSFDVVVVGGDPEGIAAAIGAARAGARTLLVDTRSIPGGLLTRGWLNTIDLNLDRRGRPLNGGLFGELFSRLDDHSFDVATMQELLEKMIENETNLSYYPGALSVLPIVGSDSRRLYQPGQTLCPDDRQLSPDWFTEVPPQNPPASVPLSIQGVLIGQDRSQTVRVRAHTVIDATQDADLAVAAGASFIRYGEDVWGSPRNMAATLVFRMSGVSTADWERMCEDLRRKPGAAGLIGGTHRSVWGYGDVVQEYKPSSERIRLRALNMGRQNDGSILVNALLV
ncbi:MAG TPA: FAD-dependent oxidoreductase, partial [Candidatus Ozemobacteraceae bacterium]|nr:FAD-dependent oxidoreductase [Candidatus Ozemobacteraceae bacterium]